MQQAKLAEWTIYIDVLGMPQDSACLGSKSNGRINLLECKKHSRLEYAEIILRGMHKSSNTSKPSHY